MRLFTEAGPLTVLAVVLALLAAVTAPASAQFFNFGGPPRPQPAPQPAPQRGPGGWFGGETREALRGFQASIGAPADGFASSDMLDRLRGR